MDYRIQALDLQTGQSKRELSTRDIFNVGHHHRCYRNRSTERFLMAFDAKTGQALAEHALLSPPVWDGLAATQEKLYLSLMDGTVICLREL